MAFYLDTSILVAVHEDEKTRPLFAHLLTPGRELVLISDFAMAESSGALRAIWRDERRKPADAVGEFSRLDSWTGHLADRIHLAPSDIIAATDFVRRPDIVLRAPDAIHIAAAHRLGATLLTLDHGMARAAAALGVAYLNPAEGHAPGEPKD